MDSPNIRIWTGDKLHQYVLQYIVEKQSHVLVDSPRNATTLHVLKNHLKCGFIYLQQQNSSSLCIAIDYGCWLNVVYDLHESEKISGRTKGTWKHCLEGNFSIKVFGDIPIFITIVLHFCLSTNM